ncbi:EamA family transporter [Gulosibacter faecalis]|uniref:DMT family transporter n=1 Tax=Gulosibacter faecalis TaxID=272240 RepID=A0ABW5UYX3_9MICO|nr:EamA family transporter [Gulosibacter faecalis]
MTTTNSRDARPASPAHPGRRSVLQALLLILAGSLGIQTSAAISSGLFDAYGTYGTSALRMLVGAAVLLVLVRPRIRGRSRAQWLGISVYGIAMAAMNICLYNAIDRIPLGIAVTLEFLGPCAVALLGSRRIREGICAVVALAGVALISVGPAGYFDLAGYLFGLGAALFFALYTIGADRIGKASSGLDGVALSVTVAAIVTLPFAVVQVPRVTPTDWGVLVLVAVIGVAMPFSVDTIAGRITSARIIGTLFAIDPAMGCLVGFVVLGQAVTVTALCGVGLVAVAGALIVWISKKPAPIGEHPLPPE